MLSDFDLTDTSATDGARASTNVPSQALFMLNREPTEQESAAAKKLVKNFDNDRSA